MRIRHLESISFSPDRRPPEAIQKRSERGTLPNFIEDWSSG